MRFRITGVLYCGYLAKLQPHRSSFSHFHHQALIRIGKFGWGGSYGCDGGSAFLVLTVECKLRFGANPPSRSGIHATAILLGHSSTARQQGCQQA